MTLGLWWTISNPNKSHKIAHNSPCTTTREAQSFGLIKYFYDFMIATRKIFSIERDENFPERFIKFCIYFIWVLWIPKSRLLLSENKTRMLMLSRGEIGWWKHGAIWNSFTAIAIFHMYEIKFFIQREWKLFGMESFYFNEDVIEWNRRIF